MISRYNVWLDDVALAEISPSIYVSDIVYQPIVIARDTSRISGNDGQRVSKDYIASNKVAVNFVCREYSTVQRQNVIQNVIAWAGKGGWLKTSDRIGQRIYVKPTRLPAVTSAMRWLDTLTVEFTAFEFPLWQTLEPSTVMLSTGQHGNLFLYGAHSNCVEATILAQEPLTVFDIMCGDTRLLVNNINIPANGVVTVSYTDERHILEIKTGTQSILDKRWEGSTDDLIAQVGENHVSFASDAGAFCTLSVKGVYL